MMPWKLVMRCLSRGERQGKLIVFIFHRVLERPDFLLPGEPDGSTFDWMVRFISGAFTVLPFGLAVQRLKNGDLPAAAACITFDDGYRDNFTVALPILQRYGATATFFVATGFLDGGRMWNDDVIESIRVASGTAVDWSEMTLGRYDLSTQAACRHSLDTILGQLKYRSHAQRACIARQLARHTGVPDRSELMMSAREVRGLRAAGMEVGAHTRSHPILSALADEEALVEICGAKADLEAILGEGVHVFAYPNGNPERDLSVRDVQLIAAAGFRAAATTAWGAATPQTDVFLIPRFTPWDRQQLRFALRCAAMLSRSA